MPRVKLGDVAREYKATIKDAKALPVVGLEHLTPGELQLENWDQDVETTFSKGFRKGQVLFGRRRAYLKKAAIAPFDGVCSGDITVIEAIPEKILPELLPFVIQNDTVRFKDNINPVFMEQQISMPFIQDQIDASKSKTSQANLFQGKIKKLEAIVPPNELQNEFLQFVEQSDKSKFELQESIKRVDGLIRSLMQNEH